MADPEGWHTTSQGTAEQYMPNGNFEPVGKVFIVTDEGTHKTFTFPEAQYTRENVVATVNEWAARQREIAALGNG